MNLPLRDVHPGVAPPWWPPAPGWWLVLVALVVVGAVLAWWWRRRAARRAAILRLFDARLADARTPPEQVAAMSELLRRAARRKDPEADRLQGEAWLRFLDDGSKTSGFSGGAGRLLLDGPYQPDADEADVEALRGLARTRYLDWMRAR